MRRISETELQSAVECLRQGGIVCYPTETFYGLGVDPWNESARAKLGAAKKRPEEKDLPFIVADAKMISQFCNTSDPRFKILSQRFWPGPLTLVLPALQGKGSYAVRVSSHAVARQISMLFDGPIISTSANLSGEPPVIDPACLNLELQRHIDVLVEGGLCAGGLPSTILSLMREPAVVLREGALPSAEVLSKL